MEKTFVTYLKSKPGLHIVMEAWKKQYIKLNHLGGRIVIQNPTLQTKEDLSTLLGKDYTYNDTITISYSFWNKQLSKTKFHECDFTEVLFLYFNHQIVSNKDKQIKQDNLLQNGYHFIEQRYQSTPIHSYTTDLINGSRSLSSNIKQAILSKTLEDILLILDALTTLPSFHNTQKLISIYANETLHNPHGFDEGSLANTFLIDYLCFLENISKDQLSLLEKNSLLTKHGIIKDDLSTHTTICHLLGISNNQVHAGWLGFYDSYEPLIVTLQNLSHINQIQELDKIYIIENPSVFNLLAVSLQKTQKNIGLICTGGQLNSADYSLLDMCQNIPLYYAGDFDPEGLLIAQKLLDRYSNLSLWNYSEEMYYQCQSNVDITEKRLSSLGNLTNPTLKRIAELLHITKKAGYQESLVDTYLMDI